MSAYSLPARNTPGISFLCSLLESVLMSTPLSFITMKKEQGYKPAEKFFVQIGPGQAIGCNSVIKYHCKYFRCCRGRPSSTILFGSTWFGIITVTTLLVLVFSEIVPKTIGTTYWKNLMGFVTSVISFLMLMWPLVIMVQLITKMLSKNDDEATVSRDEVTAMANIGAEEGNRF